MKTLGRRGARTERPRSRSSAQRRRLAPGPKQARVRGTRKSKRRTLLHPTAHANTKIHENPPSHTVFGRGHFAPSSIVLLVHDVYGQTGGEEQGAGVRAGSAQVGQGDDVVVGGGEQFFAEAGPFLGHGADFAAAFVEETEVPAFPVAFDFAYLAVGVIDHQESAADRNQLALEITERAAIGAYDPEFGAEEGESAADGNDGRLAFSFVDIDGGGHHVFLDHQPQPLGPAGRLFFGDAYGLPAGWIQDVVRIG